MDQLKHECPFCGLHFANKGNLSGHIQSIHEGKTFQCQYCEYRFTSRTSVSRHIKSIHECKTFQCQ